jgi:hypothetical protein
MFDPKYGPNWGFAIPDKRERPPIDIDPREWARRTQSKSYIRRIKRSVQSVDGYFMRCRGRMRGLTGHQRDACHYFAAVNTVEDYRRGRSRTDTNAAPKDSLLY